MPLGSESVLMNDSSAPEPSLDTERGGANFCGELDAPLCEADGELDGGVPSRRSMTFEVGR